MNKPVSPNSLEAHWMPFTANRHFKADPRIVIGAEGVYYKTADGRQVLDGISGLWCCAAGHNRPKIVEAIRKQAAELDYATSFQMGHYKAFELANRITQLLPAGLDHVFFTNSGSESADTALKMAIGYHRMRGEGHRVRLIGREKGYHGINFGGTSVGGMPGNRKMFGAFMVGVDHLRHTHGVPENRFSRGEPEHGGVDLADDLQRLCDLHDPSTIAAVIVEPVAGSAGVLVPPKGYLKRLREICDRHGILLIFDEVITGFGRLGTPFAIDHFGVVPDIVTTAKALTNGCVPMGAVIAQTKIYEAFMQAPPKTIEFMHGYTYSASPLACAAGLAALDTYEEGGLLTRGASLAGHFEDALHSLKDAKNVVDVRNLGLMGAIELAAVPGEVSKRGMAAFLKAYEKDLYVRFTGDTIAFAPPLTVETSHIDFAVDTLRDVFAAID